jgi:hypothetical protein
MRRLHLSEWASLAEVVGTIAVVISLLFVAYSLERNTTAVSGQFADQLYASVREMELALMRDPKMIEVLALGREEPEKLSKTQREQYKLWAGIYIDMWELMYRRQSQGLIQPETVHGWDEYFENWAKRNLPSEIWEELRWQYTRDAFRDRLDAMLMQQDR